MVRKALLGSRCTIEMDALAKLKVKFVFIILWRRTTTPIQISATHSIMASHFIQIRERETTAASELPLRLLWNGNIIKGRARERERDDVQQWHMKNRKKIIAIARNFASTWRRTFVLNIERCHTFGRPSENISVACKHYMHTSIWM